MLINRDNYLQQLISARGDGMIKILTGVRRCGKSFLLFTLFRNWLIDNGIPEDHIIAINLEDRMNRELRDPDQLLHYINARITDSAQYFILLDEVQMVDEFVDVLNSLLHIPNAETYVTGSNSRFLSKDVVTEFRGRGWEIRLYPLSFREYMSVYPGSKEEGWNDYMRYGGLPQIFNYTTPEQKQAFLRNIWQTVYLSDVIARYHVRGRKELAELLQVVASALGSPLNPGNLSNTFRSSAGKKVSAATIASWLEHLEDAFIIERCQRFDIRGKHYIGTLPKYYFVDPGIRNSILDFRQKDDGHLMENVIYTELRRRGYSVDVGLIENRTRQSDGSQPRQQLEVDFVVNRGSERLYIQSSLRLYDQEQCQREKRPLMQIPDSFRKILLTADNTLPWNDDDGILTVPLQRFLFGTWSDLTTGI